ncbi:MAG: alpha/beta hydrolase [Candidatus Omnitrophota bacterium]
MSILKLLVSAVLAIGLSFLFLRYIEVRTIFYPTKELASFPGRAGLDFQDVFFKAAGNVELNGWFIPSKNAKYTVLFCHGNAGNISHRIEKLKFFNELGCNVFIFDYEGYGKSRGKPSEANLYRDARAAYEYLLSRDIAPDQVIGYGESIGGAVITDLASRQEMKAVILDSTFTSTKDMIRYAYPFLPYWIFSSRFDSEAKIRNIKVPKLIIHSQDDEIVPFKLGRKLYEVSAQPKEFLKIHGGHNSNFFESAGFLKEKISNFIRDLK